MTSGQTPSGRISALCRGWNLSARGTRRAPGCGRTRGTGSPGDALTQFWFGTRLAERLLGPARTATLRPVPCVVPLSGRGRPGRFDWFTC
ncbi:MAG: hypothetical protein QG608_2000 [Actinomycetota bacterium]|nr:hypothetical protein [Actinomycetota bacterium]